MTNETDKIRERVKAMLARTVANGCTESEAMVAAGMAGKLMAEHSISITELEMKEQVCVKRTVTLDRATHSPVNGCTSAIGVFCDTKVWWSKSRYDGTMTYNFFGLESDADMAVYLFRVIEAAMATEVARFKATDAYRMGRTARGASQSFCHGFAARVGQRLMAMHGERAQEVNVARAAAGAATTGTALAVVKNAVVEAGYAALGLKLTFKTVKHVHQYNAYGAGADAGNRVNLSRPLTGGGTARSAIN